MFKYALLCAALSAPLYVYAAGGQEPNQAPVQNVPTVETTKTNAIQGTVKDTLGRPIKLANVTLQSASGEVVAHASSDEQGHFNFSGIAPGTYAVLSDKTGFKGRLLYRDAYPGEVSTTITLAASQAQEIVINATRLEKARNSLSPKTGGNVYQFWAKDINNLPQGDSTSFNQVLLQAPGVVNDSYGQLHVRGDHANTQYRINGVILPEGISGFGQILDTRFAQSIDLLTGALPAEYGDREAGIIEINTKTNFEAGGEVDMYTGSNQTYNPSFEFGNTKGDLSISLTVRSCTTISA